MTIEVLTAIVFLVVLGWAVTVLLATLDTATRVMRIQENLNYALERLDYTFKSAPLTWARSLADHFHKKGNEEGKMLAEAIIKKLSGKKRGRKPKNESTRAVGSDQSPAILDSLEG